MSLPPGPQAPTVVQTWRMLRQQIPFFEECYERYGDIFTLRLLAFPGNRLVVLADPEALKRVFTGDPGTFHAGEGNRVLGPLVGDRSVLLLDEGPHLRQRKLMLPSFHGDRMKAYGTLMTEIAEREAAAWPAGEPFQVHRSMQSLTLDVILRTVFGIEEGVRFDRLKGLLRELLDIGESPVMIPYLRRNFGKRSPWGRFLSLRDRVDEMLYEEIRRHRADPSTPERDDVLSLLLQARDEDGAPMSDRELRDELVTLLVAGHETTATALAWSLERLSRHPEVLERLTAEVQAGSDEYMDAVIKETMRSRPVLHFAMRQLKEPLELKGHELPAETRIGACIYLVHHREDLYPEPHAFKPERFLNGGADTYTWIPFGGGIRRCLGAAFAMFEMKVVLRTILEQVELQPASAPPERRKRRAITWVPSEGATIAVRPRERGARTLQPARTAA